MNPDAPRDQRETALRSIEEAGRQAAAELRRMLGVIRRGTETPERAPQPGIHDLPALVAELRQAGLDVRLAVEGQPTDAPAGHQLAAFRIVQEALTNVVKHARASRVEVRVCCEAGALAVEVIDNGSSGRREESAEASRDGHGLVGMRERVAVYGGSLEVGPLPAAGFRVRARLPLAEAAPDSTVRSAIR